MALSASCGPASSRSADGSTSASSSRVNVESDTERAGDADQVEKAALVRGAAVSLGRPPERLHEARAVKDVAARSLRPVALDEPDDRHVIELSVPGCSVVEQNDSAGAIGATNRFETRLDRLSFDPPAHRGREIVDRPGRIVVGGMSRAERGFQPGGISRFCRSRPANGSAWSSGRSSRSNAIAIRSAWLDARSGDNSGSSSRAAARTASAAPFAGSFKAAAIPRAGRTPPDTGARSLPIDAATERRVSSSPPASKQKCGERSSATASARVNPFAANSIEKIQRR